MQEPGESQGLCGGKAGGQAKGSGRSHLHHAVVGGRRGAICGGTEHGFKKLLLGTISAGKSQHSLLIRKPINGFAQESPKAHDGSLRLKARTLVKMCPLGASIFSSMRCR